MLRGDLVMAEVHGEDADLLAGFSCSTGQWFEDEVERHIRVDAFRRGTDHEDPYRLLLFFKDDDLWAVGAHQPEELEMTSGDSLMTTRLVVLAVALEYQGRRSESGDRYGEVALASLIQDAVQYRNTRTVTCLIAHENVRSQRLCRRRGLTSETTASRRYLRLAGTFVLAGQAPSG